MEYDYLKKRDPMREFFGLTLKSIKINSPHMALIQDTKEDTLYKRAIREQIPFFQWQKWLNDTLNREVLANVFSKPASKPAAKQKED